MQLTLRETENNMSIHHRAYIISDLHLGGHFHGDTGHPDFRMMDRPDALASFIRVLGEKPAQPTIELIINGDFLDFLAEESGPGEWKAFRDEPGEAVEVFETIAGRPDDGAVFDALAGFVDAGHRLTILIGNHDIELAWPEVRTAFEQRLWRSPTKKTRAFNLRWIHDGEALILGDALIEHGNRYDPANFVDHERLRQLRELRSRRLYSREVDVFYPPVGSRLVAEVMNPIKKLFPFIDLLKPESETLFALILALDPSQGQHLGELADLLLRLPVNLFEPAADPGYRQRIAGGAPTSGVSLNRVGGSDTSRSNDALAALIMRILPADLSAEANGAIRWIPWENEVTRANIASTAERVKAWWNLIKLFASKADTEIDDRLPLLQHAVSALHGDRSFDSSVETGKRYRRAAEQLALGDRSAGYPGHVPIGFRFIIFGHTHHRKKVELTKGGATYVNTGTWAKLMKFPEKLLSTDRSIARSELEMFVSSIQAGSYATEFVPTYARVDVKDDGRVDTVELFTYDFEREVVE